MSDARTLFLISGSDAHDFLQGLVTNNVDKIRDGLVYTALLTPQGKYLADFFLSQHEGGILLDVASDLAEMLKMRLTMYKLRADVVIEPSSLRVHRGLGSVPKGGFADPRAPELGWRAYHPDAPVGDDIDWTALNIAAGVPSTGIELGPDSYILEMGFETIHGVDFKKGCYVGQEVTARMKHKTELRKGLTQVTVDGDVEPGTEIVSGGKPVGMLHSRAGNKALAYLRFDRAKGEMTAGDAKITWNGGKKG